MQFDTPSEALAALLARIAPVETEACGLASAGGRVLRAPLLADRPSPAADVSAMDGYALRAEDLSRTDPLPVRGESVPGAAPPSLVPGCAVRIFTGAIVPPDSAVVVRREDTIETTDTITLSEPARQLASGANIRRCGENAAAGAAVLAAGSLLTAARIAAAANFAAATLTVARRVRVSVLVTGDELQPVEAPPLQPWQLRDSNGPTVTTLLAARPWIEVVQTARVKDDPPELRRKLEHALGISDAVVLSGGVSMGDYDDVPAAVADCGGRQVFHRLPIRPGKPVLAAATDKGQPILGLPGNPVSAAVCTLRFALPALIKRAGGTPLAPCPAVARRAVDPRALHLWWYPLVQITNEGAATPVLSRGSGDLVSLATSDGFLEVPPGDTSPGPFRYYAW